MALSVRAATGTADFDSLIQNMSSFTLSAGADAAVVNLREGAVGGTIKFVIKAALGTTVHVEFPEPVTSDSGSWYVDLSSGTTPQMTITGR